MLNITESDAVHVFGYLLVTAKFGPNGQLADEVALPLCSLPHTQVLKSIDTTHAPT